MGGGDGGWSCGGVEAEVSWRFVLLRTSHISFRACCFRAILGKRVPSRGPITVINFFLMEDISSYAVREDYLLRQHYKISSSWKNFNIHFFVLDLSVKLMLST